MDQRHYWQFQGRFYWDNDGLDASQIHALLVSKQQREAARIERAQATVALARNFHRPADVWFEDGSDVLTV